MEVMLARGVYRDGAFAQVSYDGIESIPINRALYKERGYEPPFEELPTKHEHERVGSGKAGGRRGQRQAIVKPDSPWEHRA